MKKIFFIILIILILPSCIRWEESEFQKEINFQNQALSTFISTNKINAIQSPVGFYYEKIQEKPLANRLVLNDTIGIYYEIKTLKGDVVESYLDENLPPILYVYKEGALVPKGLNYATALAKEGEVFKLYLPSYLAFDGYTAPQLFQANEQFEIIVKFAKVLNAQEIKDLEDKLIQEYLEKNKLAGFVKQEDGIFLKINSSNSDETPISVSGNLITFNYNLTQLGESIPVLESATGNYQIVLGSNNNLKFVNSVLKDVKKGFEVEALVPSHLAFGATLQVLPFQIRRDLIRNGLLPITVRPFEPTLFKTSIIDVKK
jgi:FKBP-type peptidyl-prolyl cis-trans isomerase 2